MGKKDLEKQKKIADEEAAAQAYQEFVATFEDTPKQGKLFVRGTVINSASGGNYFLVSNICLNLSFAEEISATQSGKLYKPNKLQEFEAKKSVETKPTEPIYKSEKPAKKKSEQKKKSNLELFKEELKLIQEEREERHRLKNQLKDTGFKINTKVEPDLGIKLGLGLN